MPHDADHPADQADGADALRLVVQARDAEIVMLRLLVQKLKLQIARRDRTAEAQVLAEVVELIRRIRHPRIIPYQATPAFERSTRRMVQLAASSGRTSPEIDDPAAIPGMEGVSRARPTS